MARLTRSDWIDEGFQVLRDFAQDKLTILYLCERLGVTRGSFYHHFESMEDYILALMDEWEQENTQRLIDLSNQPKDGSDKMKVLAELVFKADHRVEAALRSWSFTNRAVSLQLQKVDKIRIKHLETLFLAMHYKKSQVKHLAKLDYATLVGLQLLYPKISKREMESLYNDYWLKQR